MLSKTRFDLGLGLACSNVRVTGLGTRCVTHELQYTGIQVYVTFGATWTVVVGVR